MGIMANEQPNTGADGAKAAKAAAYNAEQIQVPVLLIHGEKDERAPISHAELLRKALTAQGRPPEWLVEPHEGHGFFDEGARERMITRLLAFLRQHTAPPAPAAASGTGAASAPAAAP